MVEHATRNRYLWPLVAFGILVVEYLTISVRFDALSLLDREGAWQNLGWMGLLGPVAFAFATAFWILGGRKVRQALARAAAAERPTARFVLRLGAHLLCFGVFFTITTLVFGTDTPPKGPPELWILLWLLAAAATVLSLLPIAAGNLRLLPLFSELGAPLGLASLLALVAWGAGISTLELWSSLSRGTLDAVAATLAILVPPIHFDPADLAVGTEDFWVRVDAACSGYEGIGLIVIFLAGYLVAFRDRFRFPHVLLLLPVAVGAVWLFNVVRIVALILVGHAGYPDIALGGFHSKAGWVFFCAVALGAVWLSQRLRWFAAEPDAPRGEVINPSAPFLLPLLAVVATALVSDLFANELDYFYPGRVVVGLGVLAWYRNAYADGLRRHLAGRPVLSWEAVGIGVVAYVLWIGISALTDPYAPEAPPEALSQLGPPLAAVWILGRLLGSIVVAPIVEELAFRGFLLRRMIGSEFDRVPYEKWSWVAVLGSSLVFAAFHQQWIGGFAAGVLYAYAQRRRGLLSDAIVAHGVTNALISAQVLGAGHWSLW